MEELRADGGKLDDESLGISMTKRFRGDCCSIGHLEAVVQLAKIRPIECQLRSVR